MRISDWSSDVCSSDLRTCREYAFASPCGFQRRSSCRNARVSRIWPPAMTFAACRSAPPARSCGSRRIFPPCRESSAPARPIECGSRYLPPAKDRWLLGRESETPAPPRSEEHTSELQSLMRISYAVFCLKKQKNEEEAVDMKR